MFSAPAPPWRSAVFISRSSGLPWVSWYQDAFTVVSDPARWKDSPVKRYAQFSTRICWVIWSSVTFPLVPSLITCTYTGTLVGSNAAATACAGARAAPEREAVNVVRPFAASAAVSLRSSAFARLVLISSPSARACRPRAPTASSCWVQTAPEAAVAAGAAATAPVVKGRLARPAESATDSRRAASLIESPNQDVCARKKPGTYPQSNWLGVGPSAQGKKTQKLGGSSLVVRRAEALVDLLARRAHGEAVRVATGHPHLAAQGDHRLARQGALQDLLLADVVREALVVPRLGDLLLDGLALDHGGALRRGARVCGELPGSSGGGVRVVGAHGQPV